VGRSQKRLKKSAVEGPPGRLCLIVGRILPEVELVGEKQLGNSSRGGPHIKEKSRNGIKEGKNQGGRERVLNFFCEVKRLGRSGSRREVPRRAWEKSNLVVSDTLGRGYQLWGRKSYRGVGVR